MTANGKSQMSESPWIRVPAACSRARCGAKQIYRAVRSGELKAARIGRRGDIVTRVDWLDEFLERRAGAQDV